MRKQITKAMLENRILYLNRLTGSPEKPYEQTVAGWKPCPGNYHLDYKCNGWGYALVRMCINGGTRPVISVGHDTKRELMIELQAFIAGIKLERIAS